MIGPRVVVVEDDADARLKLLSILASFPEFTVVGEAADGHRALHLLDVLTPDLVLLDIRLPGLSGLQVLERARHQPAVVFTTALDHHAVAAFELQAIDFVVKPYSATRLRLALARALTARGALPVSATRAREALAQTPLARIFVRDRDQLLGVPLSAIDHIEAEDDYSAIHALGRRFLVFRRLADIEAVLAPAGFLRVHRSRIVNLDAVVRVATLSRGRYEVFLRSGVAIETSRSRGLDLKRALAPL